MHEKLIEAQYSSNAPFFAAGGQTFKDFGFLVISPFLNYYNIFVDSHVIPLHKTPICMLYGSLDG